MARRPRRDEERSMDSLMDAMTNVVGILLLILIVSSLGITAVVKKAIENLPEINEEQLMAMKASREKTLENLEDLRSTHASVIKTKIKEEDAAQLALALEKFEKENKDLAEKTSDLDELLAKSKELEPLKKQKQERNSVAIKQINDLEAALAAKPAVEPPKAREITLPDPRPADPDAYVYYVACKNQKVYVIGEPYELMAKILGVLDSNFKDLAYTDGGIGSYVHPFYTPGRDGKNVAHKVNFQARSRRAREELGYMNGVNVISPQNPGGKTVFNTLFGMNEEQQQSKKEWPVTKMRFDGNKVKAFFAKNAGKGELILNPVIVGDRIKIEVGFNPEKGLTTEQLFSSGSPFVDLVKKAAVNRRVIIMYYVAPDSFDAYLRARAYSTSQRVPAGWNLWEGERLTNLQPNKLRVSMPYNFAAMPRDDYLKVAKFAGPKLAAAVSNKVRNFEADLAKVPVPKTLKTPEEIQEFKDGLKAHRQAWAKSISYYVTELYRCPLAASQAIRAEEVVIDRHPPEVMFARIFRPYNPPNAPRPKPGPSKPPGKKPPGKPPLILD